MERGTAVTLKGAQIEIHRPYFNNVCEVRTHALKWAPGEWLTTFVPSAAKILPRTS